MTLARLYTLLGALTAALFLASLTTGPATLPIPEALAALVTQSDGPATMVMREIRLPRALLAALIGASLGLSGAAMQGYLRNPLAEPGLIGVSATAAFGAVIAIQTGLVYTAALALPFMALAGAGLAVLAILALAGPRGTALSLILSGVALSALAAALTSLVLNLSPSP